MLQETISPFSASGSESNSNRIFVVHHSVDCNSVFLQIIKIAMEHDVVEFLLPDSFPIKQLTEFCLSKDFMPYIIMRRQIDSLECPKISNESETGFASSCIEIFETKLDNRTANSIRLIIQESMVEAVAKDYKGELNKKVKTLHEIAIEKTLGQPFLFFYENNSLKGFLSWSFLKMSDAMTGTLSTHWVDTSLAKHERAHLHKRMFEKLENIEKSNLFASIYFKNQKSINLFEKNSYKPYSVKLARLL